MFKIKNKEEKYEGYNGASEEEIKKNLSSLGYNVKAINCKATISDNGKTCSIVKQGNKGYCVYLCEETKYYYYKVRINMMLNVPIINNVLDIPIYSNSNRLYDFEKYNKK